MKKPSEVTLGAAIDAVLDSLKLRSGIYQSLIETKWDLIMGPQIAKHTQSINFKSGKLFITITNAPLKNELFYSRQKIREVFNKELGKEVIQDVLIF